MLGKRSYIYIFIIPQLFISSKCLNQMHEYQKIEHISKDCPEGVTFKKVLVEDRSVMPVLDKNVSPLRTDKTSCVNSCSTRKLSQLLLDV